MRKVWESSVVIALRDWQWINRKPGTQFPEEYLSLGSDAESSMADTAYMFNSRLLLIEVKSERPSITSEWRKKKNSKTKDRVKLAHTTVMDVAKDYARASVDSGLSNFVAKSVVCHHFAYWDSGRVTGLSVEGHIYLEPYALATLRFNRLKDSKDIKKGAAAILSEYGMGVSISPAQQSQIKFYPVICSSLIELADESARIIQQDPLGTPQAIWHHLGLPLPEFQEYIDELFVRQGRVHAKINAVVMSSDGRFFKHLTHSSQLEDIFHPPVPSEQIDTSRHIGNNPGSVPPNAQSARSGSDFGATLSQDPKRPKFR